MLGCGEYVRRWCCRTKIRFGGLALQEVLAGNGQSIPVTANGLMRQDARLRLGWGGRCHLEWTVGARDVKILNAPLCVAANATGDVAMDDTTDIPVARDDMTPPVRRRAFASGWNTAVAREPTFDIVGLHLRNS